MKPIRTVLLEAISSIEVDEDFNDKAVEAVVSALRDAGYVIIRDRTDPEGGIPGRG